MVTHSTKIAGSLLIVLLFSSMSLCYGALVGFELEQMWEEADSVVHGKVVKMTKFRDPHFIYTNVEVEVIDFYVQDLGKEAVNVTVYGEIPSIEGLGTEDQPWFYKGEEVFVFLEFSDLDNDQIDYFVFGSVQGKYTVEGDWATGMRESFTLPNSKEIDEVIPYTGIEFRLTLIVAFGVVLLSIFIVWLLSPN